MSETVHRYTSNTVRILRATAQMLPQSGSNAAAVEDLMSYAASKAEAARTTAAFHRWYQLTYQKLDVANIRPSLGFASQMVKDTTPILVAGLLYEFSNYVERLIDVANILGDAITLLKKRGWVQREARNEQGYCLLGAIDCAAFERHGQMADVHRNFRGVAMVVAQQLGTPLLAAWNDAPERSKADVISLFEETIDSVLRME